MNDLTLSNAQARQVFLDRHALSEPPVGGAADTALLTLIERLGFVQLDSINTLARAHDLILFSRRARYRPASLKRLYERDRALFEHWTCVFFFLRYFLGTVSFIKFSLSVYFFSSSVRFSLHSLFFFTNESLCKLFFPNIFFSFFLHLIRSNNVSL